MQPSRDYYRQRHAEIAAALRASDLEAVRAILAQIRSDGYPGTADELRGLVGLYAVSMSRDDV